MNKTICETCLGSLEPNTILKPCSCSGWSHEPPTGPGWWWSSVLMSDADWYPPFAMLVDGSREEGMFAFTGQQWVPIPKEPQTDAQWYRCQIIAPEAPKVKP